MRRWLADLGGVLVHPRRSLAAIAAGRPPAAAAAAAVAAGSGAALLSLVATLVEPAATTASRSAAVGISGSLPALFVAVWLVDAAIVDVVARAMGCAPARRRFAVTSAYCLVVLVAFEAVRAVQAAIDRVGGEAVDVATAVGFLDFGVLVWFLAVVSLAVRAVYGLPPLSAVATALAPPAAMATALMLLLVFLSLLHAAGLA